MKNENFVNTSKKLLKNRNFSRSALFHMETSVSLKYFVTDCRLEFINCILSIKTKFLLMLKVMYFSNPFGITLIFTSNFLRN